MEQSRMSAKKVITISFIVDLLDLILSLIVAILSGSVVMLSQVLEGGADLLSSGLLLVGLQKSNRLADRSHPFGYGREIYFWTLLSALIMFSVTATLSIYLGWQRFMNPEPLHNLNLAFGILALTTVTNGYAFWLSLKRLMTRHHLKQIIRIFYRSSLVETKTTFILDLTGTLASLVGLAALLIYKVTGDLHYDGIGAILIGVVLAILAFLLLLGIKDLLIGKSASPETESKIKQAALIIPEVHEILDLKTLHIGSERLLVNLEVHLQSRLTTREIEKLIDKIKLSIQQSVPSVKHIQVELETPD